MRLFCAVELPAGTRQTLASAVAGARARLDRDGFDARWTPDENLHLTVWFFGECDDAAADALREKLSTPLPIPRFVMELGGAGVFPSSGVPSILWVGVRDGGASLSRLHTALAVRLEPLGYRPEPRPFHPHVTIARVRGRPSAVLARAAREFGIDPMADAGRCGVADLTLFRSRLSPRGARHEPVVRVPLKE